MKQTHGEDIQRNFLPIHSGMEKRQKRDIIGGVVDDGKQRVQRTTDSGQPELF